MGQTLEATLSGEDARAAGARQIKSPAACLLI
jgi:hypothetical protein